MDHIFLPRKLNLVKLRKCQCMEIRLTSYWSRKEKRMVTVLKTAIICATIVAVVYLLMKNGDDKKKDDQKGEE